MKLEFKVVAVMLLTIAGQARSAHAGGPGSPCELDVSLSFPVSTDIPVPGTVTPSGQSCAAELPLPEGVPEPLRLLLEGVSGLPCGTHVPLPLLGADIAITCD